MHSFFCNNVDLFLRSLKKGFLRGNWGGYIIPIKNESGDVKIYY